MAQSTRHWRQQKSTSERAGRMAHVAWLPSGSLVIHRSVNSLPQGSEI